MTETYRVSHAALWARCRRKFLFSQEWETGPGDMTEANIGTVVHGWLADYYDPTHGAFDDNWFAAYEDLDPESIQTARAMFDTYVTEVEQEGLDVGVSTVSVENRLTEPIGSVFLSGQIDHIYYDEVRGGHVIQDHKTVGQFFTTAPRDFQLMCYAWLAHRNGVENIVWVEHNQIKRNKRTGRAKPPFIHRTGAMTSDRGIAAFGAALSRYLWDMQKTLKGIGKLGVEHVDVMPMGKNDCSWSCSFVDVCGMVDDGEDYAAVLETEFHRREAPVDIV